MGLRPRDTGDTRSSLPTRSLLGVRLALKADGSDQQTGGITTQVVHLAPEVKQKVMHDEDNDGGFPGESPVEVPLPA